MEQAAHLVCPVGQKLQTEARATFTLRNGIGTNPTDYRCTSLPVVGGTWTGDISPPVPQLPALFGFTLSSQGARVESVGAPIVLLNALDPSFWF